MKIQITANTTGSPDGIRVVGYGVGQICEVGDDNMSESLAKGFIADGKANALDADGKPIPRVRAAKAEAAEADEAEVVEEKAIEGAPENKAEKKVPANKKQGK